jgi:hypothetical protein
MKLPELDPFDKANACESCPQGQHANAKNAWLSCTNCTVGKYTIGIGSDSCAPNTVCGNQATGTSRVNGASRVAAGTCAVCDADTFAVNGTTHCAPNTVCGKQVTGVSRVNGASRVAAGTCSACAADTFAVHNANDCVPNTVCGKQSNGAGRANGDASRVAAGTCAACVSGTSATADTVNCVKDTSDTAPSPVDDNDQHDSELDATIRSHQISTLCIVCSTFVVTVMLALM